MQLFPRSRSERRQTFREIKGVDMFNSINDLAKANDDAGYHWFDKDSMEFFDSIIYPELIQHPEGAYFISSEKFDSQSPRLFTVRFTRFSGETNTVGPFQGFSSKENAWQWALGHKDGIFTSEEA